MTQKAKWKKGKRKDKEEVAKSGKRERGRRRERVDLDDNRVCFGFSSCLVPQEDGVKVASFRETGDGVSDDELAGSAFVSVALSDYVSPCDPVGLSACVFHLIASPDSESEFLSVSPQTSQFFSGVS